MTAPSGIPEGTRADASRIVWAGEKKYEVLSHGEPTSLRLLLDCDELLLAADEAVRTAEQRRESIRSHRDFVAAMATRRGHVREVDA